MKKIKRTIGLAFSSYCYVDEINITVSLISLQFHCICKIIRLIGIFFVIESFKIFCCCICAWSECLLKELNLLNNVKM